MLFRRLRDNQMVPASEACDASGAVKSGYAASFSHGQRVAQPGDYFSFDMSLMDKAPSPSTRVYLQDEPGGGVHLSDADRAAVIARAAMMHRTSTAYLGDRAPAFTEAMAQLAVDKARSDLERVRTNDAAFAAGADAQRAANETARAQMIDAIRNGWRN